MAGQSVAFRKHGAFDQPPRQPAENDGASGDHGRFERIWEPVETVFRRYRPAQGTPRTASAHVRKDRT